MRLSSVPVLLILILIIFPVFVSAQSYDSSHLEIPRGTDLEKLILDCRTIELQVAKKPAPRYPDAVYSRYDYHFLADVPLAKLEKVLEQRDKYEDVYPRLIEYDWKEVESSGAGRIFIEDEQVGVDILGIKSAYHYSIKTLVSPKNNSNFSMRWVLENSHDKKIGKISGSWYFKEIELDGKIYTYMRYYNECYFLDPSPGTIGILKNFTKSDIEKLFKSFTKAAKKD